MFRNSFCASVAAVVVGCAVCAGAAAAAYRSATIDERGRVNIVTSGGRRIVLRKDPDQVGVDCVRVSDDGRAVGWVPLYLNCCTSYPIPNALLLYVNGKVRRLSGSGLPVWRWMFVDGGKRVAFEQETVHGGIGAHYELRDVASGRLIDQYDPSQEDDDRTTTPNPRPAWVVTLDAMKP